MPNSDHVKQATGLAGVLDGFVFAAVGNKVAKASAGATTDTATLSNALIGMTPIVLLVTYADSTKEDVISVERTA